MIDVDPSNETQQYLITRVKQRMDEVTARGQSVGADGDKVLEELNEAADEVLESAPYKKALPSTTDAEGASTSQRSDVLTRVTLPTDFLRLLLIELESWDRPVAETIDASDSLYYQQFREHERRDPLHPIVAEAPDADHESGMELHCFPQGDGPTIQTLEYVPQVVPSNMPSSRGLRDAMIWEAAARVLQSQNDGGAGAAASRARTILFGEVLSEANNNG